MKSIIVMTLFVGVAGNLCLQPVFAADAGKARETIIYSFQGGGNGFVPRAGLLDVKGTLYGTTEFGGSSDKGTLFAVNLKTGAQKVLHSFVNSDGELPEGSLLDGDGTLYGMTGEGGAYNYGGTVFAFSPAKQKLKVLHSFGNGNDGGGPNGLMYLNGALYGTTADGGTYGYGTVFELDPQTGAEQVLYSFGSGTDGRNPEGLIDINGVFYGTTANGGAGGNVGGTIFAFDPTTSQESVLYSFCNQPKCTDGWFPLSSLIDVKGTLYGTTQFGGTSVESGGTVFGFDLKTGAETVLYSFCSLANCSDGEFPQASLIDVKGTLYGTTTAGGTGKKGGDGTAFGLNLVTGAESTLYSFCGLANCKDGQFPYANFIDVKGMLYSTTSSGGADESGTVFVLKP